MAWAHTLLYTIPKHLQPYDSTTQLSSAVQVMLQPLTSLTYCQMLLQCLFSAATACSKASTANSSLLSQPQPAYKS